MREGGILDLRWLKGSIKNTDTRSVHYDKVLYTDKDGKEHSTPYSLELVPGSQAFFGGE